jgi:ferredoxin-NADP reductase
MAEQREAKVCRITRHGEGTAVFTLELARAGEAVDDDGARGEASAPTLGFVGGQYVIVNTKIPLPGGKIVKRPYSIISPERQHHRFEIAVKRIGEGLGSSFMHALAVGDEIALSGPWGKLIPGEDLPGDALIVATDTGITAALGLVQAEAFAERIARADLIWLMASAGDFLPEAEVRARLPGALRSFTAILAPPIRHPERAAFAKDTVEKLTRDRRPESAFLVGDGGVVHPLREALTASGLPADRVRLEGFFNNPDRKAT